MLFFIDETWQELGGQQVGALGAVALPQAGYNRLCREVFAIKQEILGAKELSDAELKGTKCFANRSFRARETDAGSKLLIAADAMFDALSKHGAHSFVIWTTHADLVALRSMKTTELSPPYKQLLHDFRALMEQEAPRRLGSLNFDQRNIGSDEAAACALQNYLVRTRGARWEEHFLTVPNFTVSAVSPGLQAADLVAYLGAHNAPNSGRPELQPSMDRLVLWLGSSATYSADGHARSWRPAGARPVPRQSAACRLDQASGGKLSGRSQIAQSRTAASVARAPGQRSMPESRCSARPD